MSTTVKDPSKALISDTEIYKNTYRDLVLKYKDLLWQIEWWKSLDNNSNYRKYLENLDRILTERQTRITERELAVAEKERYTMGMIATVLEDKQDIAIEEFAEVENVIDLEKFKASRIGLKIGGGFGPGDKDWLTPMPWGAQFYVRPKVQKTWMLAKFLKAGARGKVIYLVPMAGVEDIVEDERQWLPVEAKAFCSYFDLIEYFTEKDNE